MAQMADVSSADLLAELNNVERRIQYFNVALIFTVLVFGCVTYVLPTWWLFVLVSLPTVPLLLWARHSDVTNGTVFLRYQMDEVAEQAFDTFKVGFQRFNCNRIWNLEAEGKTRDWKHNAGATGIVRRKRTSPKLACPPRLVTNISVASISSGRETLYFFPDRILVYQGKSVGAISYADLDIATAQQVFVESERVPNDAKVVGHTWRFVNKDGGPDRRFKDNHQIPLALYGEIRLKSTTGLNEVFQTSKTSSADALRQAIEEQLGAGKMSKGVLIATLVRPGDLQEKEPQTEESSPVEDKETPPTTGMKVWTARK